VGDGVSELDAGVDAEFAVDAGEGRLDRLDADAEARGDVTVAGAARG
jgi:hypothetical protein